MVVYEPALPLADLNPAAPSDLQRIVRRCLAKDPDERYQTIKEVAIELKELRRHLASAVQDATVPPTETQSQQVSTSSSTGSSAEYIFSSISQHRVAAAIVAV